MNIFQIIPKNRHYLCNIVWKSFVLAQNVWFCLFKIRLFCQLMIKVTLIINVIYLSSSTSCSGPVISSWGSCWWKTRISLMPFRTTNRMVAWRVGSIGTIYSRICAAVFKSYTARLSMCQILFIYLVCRALYARTVHAMWISTIIIYWRLSVRLMTLGCATSVIDWCWRFSMPLIR